ncbi:uncharacterized protein LOC111027506 [Myzus persicae]|uniref:uncharacterized protein LOC111027506 n=1 Tax=Myzus persicae TaxID=13164 RepID=UPI000B935828|nr:uncharacterized protein LOC111027506 [Myzus persicae]
MARRQNVKKKIEYDRRLKELKQKLKPYRNSQTVNLLRVITGSSGVYLNKYFETLESVLTGGYSHRDVIGRIQTVVNKILENGEYSRKKPHLDCNVDILDKNLTQNVLKPSVFTNDRHPKIDSKASVFNNVRHSDTNSKASMFDNVRHSDINLKGNVFGNVKHSDINSKASMFDNVRHSDINLKGNMFGDVKQGNIDQNLNFINRINHLHINSCNETCYRIKKDII